MKCLHFTFNTLLLYNVVARGRPIENMFVTSPREGEHIVFGADPVDFGIGMTFSCVQDIS